MNDSKRVTTIGGIKAVDITFRGGRYQSEINKELGIEERAKGEPEIPETSNPKAIVEYYAGVLSSGVCDGSLADVYKNSIKIINAYIQLEKENKELKLKLLRMENGNENS